MNDITNITMLEKELEEINKKINIHNRNIEDKKESFSNSLIQEFNNIFTCKINDRYIRFIFTNDYESHEIQIIPKGDNDVHFSINHSNYVSRDNCANALIFLSFYSMLLNSEKGKNLTDRIINFWNELQECYNKNDITGLYSQQIKKGKAIKALQEKKSTEECITNEYYEVTNSFYIKNNKKRWSYGRGRYSSRNRSERLGQKSIIRISAVSKRKVNFTLSCLIDNKVISFSNIHANFIKTAIKHGYLKIISPEDVLERAMELIG